MQRWAMCFRGGLGGQRHCALQLQDPRDGASVLINSLLLSAFNTCDFAGANGVAGGMGVYIQQLGMHCLN